MEVTLWPSTSEEVIPGVGTTPPLVGAIAIGISKRSGLRVPTSLHKGPRGYTVEDRIILDVSAASIPLATYKELWQLGTSSLLVNGEAIGSS